MGILPYNAPIHVIGEFNEEDDEKEKNCQKAGRGWFEFEFPRSLNGGVGER